METPDERELHAFVSRAAMHQPHDPSVSGMVGKGRKGVYSAAPDPTGNRAERRAWKKAHRDNG